MFQNKNFFEYSIDTVNFSSLEKLNFWRYAMKVLSVLIIVLAVLIAVLPQLTDCQSQGRQLTLANGQTVPMKCHWTAIAELVLGIPLAILGIELFLSRHKETRMALGILGAALGLFIILIPTLLIGVCTMGEMLCNSVMKPALILAGSLVIVCSVIIAVVSERQDESSEPAKKI
jgi:hypothetical protein